jgi:GT2 family glycosyltransferase
MEEKYDVSIIIVNYKTPKLCCDCIDSIIAKSQGFSYELIVIDNASHDDSQAIICRKFGNKIQFVANSENGGTARSFNQGARLSQGKYLFFINTDTLLINNAILILKLFLDAHTNVGIVGGNLYNSNYQPTHSFCRKLSIKEYKKETSILYLAFLKLFRVPLSMQFNYSKKPMEVEYICGADFFVRKDLYLSIGGYDEDIFIYGDDFLFSYQCKKEGYLSYSVPDAKIIHFEGNSFKKDLKSFSEKRFLTILKGTGTAMEKAYGPGSKYLFYKYSYIKRRKLLVLASLFFRKTKASFLYQEKEILKKVLNGDIKI